MLTSRVLEILKYDNNDSYKTAKMPPAPRTITCRANGSNKNKSNGECDDDIGILRKKGNALINSYITLAPPLPPKKEEKSSYKPEIGRNKYVTSICRQAPYWV